MSAALALARGDRVEVHTRSAGPHQWMGGVVFKVAGKGAFVTTDAGHENFYRWKDIRIVNAEASPKPESGRRIVTLPSHATVEVIERSTAKPPGTLRSPTSFSALSSSVVPAGPAAPAPRPEPPSPPPPSPAVVPLRRDHRPSPPSSRQAILMDLHPGVTSKHGTPPRQLHDPTPIGDAFRAYRLRRGYAQNEMADRLGVTGSTLSQVELGDRIPNDDLILAFAEETATPLDELIKLRETSRVPIAAPAPTPIAEPPAPAPAPPPPPKRALLPFSEVVVAVEAIVPMPEAAEKRARWIQVVTELYELRATQ